jgi:hypothetical protein
VIRIAIFVDGLRGGARALHVEVLFGIFVRQARGTRPPGGLAA